MSQLSLFLAAVPLLAPQRAPGTSAPAAVAHMAADAPLPAYAAYTLAGVAGGKLLEVAGNPTYNEKYDDARPLVQFSPSVTNGVPDGWQQWHVIYKTTLGGAKCYHFRNVFSGKLLTAPATAVPGAQLQQYAELTAGADRQLWHVVETATPNHYRILNRGNGLALSNAGASANGAAITQEAANAGAASQRWVFAAQAPVAYRDDQVVRFFNRNNPAQGSVAFDEGVSIPLTWGPNNGKVLWVTQDACDGSKLQPNGLFGCGINITYSNSLLLQPSVTNWDNLATPNVTLPNGSNGRARQVCDVLTRPFNNDRADYTYAWPGAGIEIGNHVYIHCGEGRFDTVRVRGQQSLYDFTQSGGTQWTATRTTPAGLNAQTAINYATGMVKAADGYVYAFGMRTTSFGYGSDIHVARFPASNPQDWTFWNGASWVSTPVPGSVARVAEGKGSNYVAYLNGRYILMTLGQGYNCPDTDRSIYLATATSPTGPFTPLTKVYDIKEYLYGSVAQYYTPAIHPEFVNGRNELLLTYCLNYNAQGCPDNRCVNNSIDPYFYRIKGVRVPYSLLGLPTLAAQSVRPALAVEVFPNPARGAATVQLPAAAGTTAATLTLTDVLGRTVQSRTATPTADRRHELNLTGLAPGLYTLRVQVGAASAARRLVVQ